MPYQASRDIAAPAEVIWDILTDGHRLQSADLGILRIEGRIEPGARIRLWSEVAPKRAFSLRVAAFEPGRRMTWTGGMPLGLFVGTRQFCLSSQNDVTKLEVEERFTGPLSPLIQKSMPDLTPSFEKLVDGIKRLAEGQVS